MNGALGFCGPCFPRVKVAFSAMARANGVPALLAEATDAINRRQVARLAKLLQSRLPEGGTVGVLGLSYKPETEVIEESQGVALAQELAATCVRVVVYDPAAMANARAVLNGDVTFAASASECASQADVVAITTAWKEFGELRAEDLKGVAVLDCWRVLDGDRAAAAGEYLALGRPRPSAPLQREAARA
jgi:UDPglucose 6-dehydrogenase